MLFVLKHVLVTVSKPSQERSSLDPRREECSAKQLAVDVPAQYLNQKLESSNMSQSQPVRRYCSPRIVRESPSESPRVVAKATLNTQLRQRKLPTS